MGFRGVIAGTSHKNLMLQNGLLCRRIEYNAINRAPHTYDKPSGLLCVPRGDIVFMGVYEGWFGIDKWGLLAFELSPLDCKTPPLRHQTCAWQGCFHVS